MKTPICDCGSEQVNYVGIDDVEGNVIIELFKCEECFSYIERRTVVETDDDDDDDFFPDDDVIDVGEDLPTPWKD